MTDEQVIRKARAELSHLIYLVSCALGNQHEDPTRPALDAKHAVTMLRERVAAIDGHAISGAAERHAPPITPYRALILLFRENAIPMSDRNSYLWTLIEDGLVPQETA